VTLRSSEMAFH